MEVELAELAAVIAGGDRAAARSPRRRRRRRRCPARMAARDAAAVRPSMTISSTDADVGRQLVADRGPSGSGRYASLVEASRPLYFEPTFEPERTMPPGNGMMTRGRLRIAATARSAAASTAGRVAPEDQEIAAADRLLGHAGLVLARNSPSITGIRQ